MRIGILGSGLMGGKLGTIWARAGHEVIFSYARSRRKLERLAREAGRNARAGTPAQAAEADVLLWAVHWLRFRDVARQAGTLDGKIILNCSLPMNADNTALAVGRTTSAAEELQKRLPKARVVSAFNTVPSEVFFDVFRRRRRPGRPHLVFCGDHAASKKVASRLIADVGFEPLDVGPLRLARYSEPFALLVARMAYEGTRGDRMAYRFAWYGG